MHILSWIPLLVLLWDYFGDNLGYYPAQQVTFRTGKLALIFLMLSLACTPLYTLSKYSPVIKLRRPLGLYAFLYASIHLLSFSGLDYQFNWAELLPYILEKRYIFVGLITFILLFLLAITSFKWWMIRLGKNWKRLHRLVYIAAPLAILHFALVVKGNLINLSGDIIQPLLFSILAAVLLILRIPPVKKAMIAQRNRYLPNRKIVINPHPRIRKTDTPIH
jgi:methionine sulfoxide reductase heme-binding subunit